MEGRALAFVPLLIVPLIVLAGLYRYRSLEAQGFQCVSPLLLVNYHKTGHDASRILARALGQILSARFDDVMSRDEPAVSCSHLVAGSPLRSCHGVQGSPDLLCRPFPKGLRVIHFVRDPVGMIISAYMYHSQEPPPEQWVHTRRVCADSRSDPVHSINPVALRRFAQAAGVPHAELTAVAKLCHKLHPANASFHAALRSLSPERAIKLVATWLVGTNADVLRMAANAASLAEMGATAPAATSAEADVDAHSHARRGVNAFSQSVDLADLSRDAPGTLLRLVGWLRNHSSDRHLVSRLNDASSAALVENFARTQREAQSKVQRRHVTRDSLSEREHDALRKTLLDDNVIGPVLKRVTLRVFS